MKMILIGAYGRFGSRICALAKADPRFHIIAKIGRGQMIDPFLEDADVVLDVSTPQALEENLPKIVKAKKPLVIGTTGHTDEQKKKIGEAAKQIPLVHSSNFAPGIALLKKLIPHLPSATYEIREHHHSKKKDAPSGTALDLAALLSKAEITSKREGDTIGEHTIVINLPYERIEIKHEALTRDVFAFGALEACASLLSCRA